MFHASGVDFRIARAIENAGLSPGQVARRLDVPRERVVAWFGGTRNILPEELVALRDLAQCSWEWLLTGRPRPELLEELPEIERQARDRGLPDGEIAKIRDLLSML